jgi:hypothetical protein
MQVEQENYQRYIIKSGRLNGEWAAKAFRRKLLVAQATGNSREEAVTRVKAELARLEALALSACDSEGAPPAQVYEAAFVAIRPLNDGYRAMLTAHLRSPDRLISATKLAEAAGYRSYSGANLHYGKLGYAIAQEIGFEPPSREDGSKIWTCTLARDPSADLDVGFDGLVAMALRHMDAPHFEWQLRPQVAEALLRLGY